MENKQINELNEVYDYLSSNDELYHYGVLGMKWGIRRYQPYSLIPRGSGKRGKEVGAAKKSKSTGSSSSSSKRTKKKSRKQTQAEIKAQKIKNLQTARQRAEEKQKILKSGDAKLIYENRDSFTRAQMEEAMQRINTEKTLRSLVAEQNPSRSTKMKRTLSKVVNAENLQKTADLIEKGANLYNQTARVANVFRDDEHQLKYVGKAENKKPDDNKISKAAMNIIKTGDVAKILENQGSFSNAEVKAAKDRLNDIASIRSQQKGLVKFDTEMVKALDDNKKAKRESVKNENDYQKQQREERQKYLNSSIQSIEEIKRDYGEGGKHYIPMTPSPQKPTNTKVTTSKQVLDSDASLFTPSTRKSKKFDDYFDSEVAKVNPYGEDGITRPEIKKKKNLSHSEIPVNELYHHGVLGMKWGIRRYQSYDTVPRGSGKGGKEIGEAKGSNKTSKSNTSSNSSSKPYSERNAEELFGNKAMGIKSMKDITDPELLELSYMEMYEYKDPDWSMSPDAAKKDYQKFVQDPEAYRQDLLASDSKSNESKVSEKTSSIKFESAYHDYIGEYLKGETSFGGNDKCLITIQNDSYKPAIDKVLNNKKLESLMREHASEMSQYESLNPNNESKEIYKKRLKCEQITAQNEGNPDIVSVWYGHPDDSGAWYMQVNSKTGYIEDEQYYR